MNEPSMSSVNSHDIGNIPPLVGTWTITFGYSEPNCRITVVRTSALTPGKDVIQANLANLTF